MTSIQLIPACLRILRRPTPLAILLLLLVSTQASALTPDEIALVVNKNVPDSLSLAEHYAKARSIPAGRIIALDLPATPPFEDLSREDYDKKAVPAIRTFLTDHQLRDKIKCLVTFYGVPFRLGQRLNTPVEKKELAQLRDELKDIRAEIEKVVLPLEKQAALIDNSFTPKPGAELDQLAPRADHVIAFIQSHLAQVQDEKLRGETFQLWVNSLEQLGGSAAMLARFGQSQIKNPNEKPEEREKWLDLAKKVQAAANQVNVLQDRPEDPQARQQVRTLVKQFMGMFLYARVVNTQIVGWDAGGTGAAVDNELCMVWWDHYMPGQWVPNLLNYTIKQVNGDPVLMVMRLDAPTPAIVTGIIDASVKAETEGLKGRVVVDSGGSKKLGPNDRTYAEMDTELDDLASLIATKTKLELTHDQKPEVLPANSVQDVALYCGWYSVHNYVPACKFNPGAVGYHVASFELTTLRNEQDHGWVRGLLADGIAGTLGPVAEPYLHAFPKPNEFFPLLLTGKLTLAEVYWKTNPLASWMMAMIGDPLYNPYKAHPALAEDDLPPNLRQALHPQASAPSTRPASMPAAAPQPVPLPLPEPGPRQENGI